MSYYEYDGSLALETPAPVTHQFGSSAGNETLVGGAGPDELSAEGPNDLLIGNGGGDTFDIKAAGDRIQETAGGAPNQITSWQNIDLANYANIQNLSVGGTNTYAAGDAQNNVIYATGSHQQLYGGGGQDVLVGNGQSDTFIVVKGEGNDAIYNFNPATDVVRLSAGYNSFAQLQQHMTQVGADVNIDMGGGSAVVLRNITKSQLSAANFQLQLDASQVGPMTFGDEFNSLNLWNNTSGTWSTTYRFLDPNGNGGTLSSNNEQEWYINANYGPTASVKPWAVSGGVLSITAAPAAANIKPLINNYQYTSGEINTYHSFAQTYGYFEMRAELPQNAGGWPAFWLLPEDGSWPPELDVMETLTNDPRTDYSTSHSSIGGNTYSQGVAFIPDTTSGYHTYGVLWTKTTLTWFVDGTQVYQTATPTDMNKPMYMIANLALGGWGGNVDPSQLPAQLKIDYIHAYALADGSSSVALNTAPADTAGAGPDTGIAAAGPYNTTTPGTPGGGGGSPPPPPPPGTGQVFTSPGPGAVETGGAGNDTFYASQGNDTLTGGGGADVFVFKAEPWAPDHITDFQVGADKLDLTALFQAAGYTGSDPVADHYIYFESDGNGGTYIRYDHDGTGPSPVWPNTIIDLEHVSPTGLTWSQIAVGPAGGSGGGGGGGGGGAAPTAPTGLADAAIANGYVNQAHDGTGQALTGSAAAGATITVYDGATTLGTTSADATTGQWSFTLGHLPDGAHALSATATTAGGVSPSSATLSFTVDTQAPVPHVGDIIDAAGKSEKLTGVSEAGSTVKIFDGNVLLANVTADSSGAWSFTARIGNGVHSFTEQATDRAGNPGQSAGVALFSQSGNAKLVGGTGDDVLVGRGGDTLTGGGGHDTFVFHAKFGLQTVTDFDPQADVISINHTMFASFASVLQHAVQSGTSTIITYDASDVITLKNTTMSALGSGNFVFV
jgi:beta-glucanase (GH16 family)